MGQGGSACESHAYGEVFRRNAPNWTTTDMGSGQFSNAGFGRASYVARQTYIDASGTETNVTDAPSPTPYDPLCYDRSALTTYNTVPIVYLGGPGAGADNPACVK